MSDCEEVWKAVEGASGYEVSDQGRIRSYRLRGNIVRVGDTPRVVKTVVSVRGYRVMDIRYDDGVKRKRKVSHLVLEAFVGPRPTGQGSLHGNDIKEDNRLSNLRWGTPAENKQDCFRNGNVPQGSDCHNAILTPELVRELRRAWEAGTLCQSEAARQLGMNRSSLCNVINRKNWTCVE